jgi:hypothetical protein
MSAESVPHILDKIMLRPFVPSSANEEPLSLPHWRGRMGLTNGEQVQLYDSFT